MTTELADCRWLLSSAAEPWLMLKEDEPIRLLRTLRRDLSASRAHLVAEQIDLRRRAGQKFRLADCMFFTRKGLEQATDEQIAAYKAARFPESSSKLDLCCGIGGDLLALAGRGPTVGVDRDEVVSLFAAANATVHGFDSQYCQLKSCDIGELEPQNGNWHCDPDRRPAGHRSTRGELFEPTLETLESWLKRSPDAAIKLAPATELSPEWGNLAEREWIESRGECRQQVAWFGKVARYPGRRSATVLLLDGRTRTVVGNDHNPTPVAARIGHYLYEPAAAVLAAKLATELCREHHLAAISSCVAYLTGDNAIADLALVAFEVLDVLPFDRKQLRAYCRKHHIGRLEIKKRGVELDPDRLRKEIIAAGDNETTLLIAPHSGKTQVFVARRWKAT